MLRQRILTAVVLLALLLPALIVTAVWPFALLTLAAMAVAGWEWVRLNDGGAYAIALGARPRAACALALVRRLGERRARAVAWWLAFAIWVLGGTWLLRGGVAGWQRLPRALRWAVGLVALWTAWLALANAKAAGLNFILSIFLLVWAADIFAYFGGRALGRKKLAPAISPGKSWEGVWSGMIGALLIAVAWLAIDASGSIGMESIYTIITNRFGYCRPGAGGRVSGGDERRRRPDRVAGQARRRRQGQQRAAARARWHSRSRRRAAAGVSDRARAGIAMSATPPRAAPGVQRVCVLGSTGSVGMATLDVIARHPERFEVFALTARRRLDELFELCLRFRPRHASVATAGEARALERAPARRRRRHRGHERRGRAVRAGRASRGRCRDGGDRRRRRPGALPGRGRAPASACCSPTRKRWSSAARSSSTPSSAAGRPCCRSTASTRRSSSACPQDRGTWHERIARIVLTASGGPFRGARSDDARRGDARTRPAPIPTG